MMRSQAWSRAAVFLLFGVFGICIATWAVHIPSVAERTGVSAGTLGTMLFLLGAGALTGMQISGPLVTRWGGARVALAGALGMSSTLALPLNAPTPILLAAAMLTFGVASGITDVGMNARAVTVEQRAGKPIMSAFHAMFSVGSVFGSLVGAGTLAVGWSLGLTSAVMCSTCLLLVAVAAPNLLGERAERAAVDHQSEIDEPAVDPKAKRRRLILLAVVAFLLYLAEGSAMDWSSLHAQEHLGAPNALGALAFASFVTAMTIGRFSADFVKARKGAVWVVRYGSIVSGIGLLIVVVSPVLPLTVVGWLLVGIGLSGGVPLVFSAAGNVPGVTGTEFSRVIGGGYVALLAGPALIGWLSELVTLNYALVLPLLGVVVAALCSRVVKPVG
jgi:predicted MFS family arabinose efflux permease